MRIDEYEQLLADLRAQYEKVEELKKKLLKPQTQSES